MSPLLIGCIAFASALLLIAVTFVGKNERRRKAQRAEERQRERDREKRFRDQEIEIIKGMIANGGLAEKTAILQETINAYYDAVNARKPKKHKKMVSRIIRDYSTMFLVEDDTEVINIRKVIARTFYHTAIASVTAEQHGVFKKNIDGLIGRLAEIIMDTYPVPATPAEKTVSIVSLSKSCIGPGDVTIHA